MKKKKTIVYRILRGIRLDFWEPNSWKNNSLGRYYTETIQGF